MTERHEKWQYLTLGCAVVMTLLSLNSPAQPSSWPLIRALRETHTFVNPGQGGTDSPFLAVIKDTAGVPIYKLECHNGNYETDSEMNFSGDFQCALFALNGSKIASGNLLATNSTSEQSTDWWNRGRMRSAQLRGMCLKYPEYSTDRQFKLRGMLVTLQFADIRWSDLKDQQNNPRLTNFTFTFNVIPDKDARGSVADLAIGPVPPHSCYP